MTIRRDRQLVAGAVLVIALAVGLTPAVTLARLSATQGATATFVAGTVNPPTGVTGTGGTSVTLTWTASGTASVTGYTLYRSSTSGSGYTSIQTITGRTTTSTTDSPGQGVWFYVLRSTAGGWTSAASNEVRVGVGRQTTAVMGCTANAAVAGMGDGDGYELNPGNACASDGAVATDANSGTNNATSCSNAGKDKHDFWGYDFGLPASVTSVDGITITAIAGTSTTSAGTGICIQVSGDGGATWSAAQSVSFGGSALATYSFGGATDVWGKTWSPSALGTSSFRIRVSDIGSTTSKTFVLDFVGASVTYTP